MSSRMLFSRIHSTKRAVVYARHEVYRQFLTDSKMPFKPWMRCSRNGHLKQRKAIYRESSSTRATFSGIV